jgi:hypothetical protein
MKKSSIILLSSIACILMVILISLGQLWSHRNTAVDLEERVNAQYRSNQSNYDSMWKKLVEMTQVTELQAKQFKDVYTGLITGRYNDSKLLFKAIKEQNPSLNTKVYINIQEEISAGRTTFDENQKQLQDIIREYNSYIRKKIIMTAVTGRKELDYDKYLVTSQRTSNAFNTGKDDVIDLSGKSK